MLKCIMCSKGITDEGILFCPKCRKKDILKRLNAYLNSKYYDNFQYRKERIEDDKKEDKPHIKKEEEKFIITP